MTYFPTLETNINSSALNEKRATDFHEILQTPIFKKISTAPENLVKLYGLFHDIDLPHIKVTLF